jgi:hypothetical protein
LPYVYQDLHGRSYQLTRNSPRGFRGTEVRGQGILRFLRSKPVGHGQPFNTWHPRRDKRAIVRQPYLGPTLRRSPCQAMVSHHHLRHIPPRSSIATSPHRHMARPQLPNDIPRRQTSVGFQSHGNANDTATNKLSTTFIYTPSHLLRHAYTLRPLPMPYHLHKQPILHAGTSLPFGRAPVAHHLRSSILPYRLIASRIIRHCIFASLHPCILAPLHLCIFASLHLCIFASLSSAPTA